jgi:hypothetical protein
VQGLADAFILLGLPFDSAKVSVIGVRNVWKIVTDIKVRIEV